jgi:hypothetical protein
MLGGSGHPHGSRHVCVSWRPYGPQLKTSVSISFIDGMRSMRRSDRGLPTGSPESRGERDEVAGDAGPAVGLVLPEGLGVDDCRVEHPSVPSLRPCTDTSSQLLHRVARPDLDTYSMVRLSGAASRSVGLPLNGSRSHRPRGDVARAGCGRPAPGHAGSLRTCGRCPRRPATRRGGLAPARRRRPPGRRTGSRRARDDRRTAERTENGAGCDGPPRGW